MEAGGTVGSPQKPRRRSERGRDVYEQGLLGLVGLAGLCILLVSEKPGLKLEQSETRQKSKRSVEGRM